MDFKVCVIILGLRDTVSTIVLSIFVKHFSLPVKKAIYLLVKGVTIFGTSV